MVLRNIMRTARCHVAIGKWTCGACRQRQRQQPPHFHGLLTAKRARERSVWQQVMIHTALLSWATMGGHRAPLACLSFAVQVCAATHKIAVLSGDGIGPEITAATLPVSKMEEQRRPQLQACVPRQAQVLTTACLLPEPVVPVPATGRADSVTASR